MHNNSYPGADRYPHLFSPLKIGPVTLKNRIEAAPVGVSHGSPEGYLTTENLAAYELRARGGAAIIDRGETIVHTRTGRAHGGKANLDDEGLMPTHLELTQRIHRYNALASIELVHSGARAHPRYTGGVVYGPSAQPGVYGVDVTPLDEDMMDEIADAFAHGAFVAQFGGFDLCMIHGGHGWLLHQFLSPLYNTRKDQYGGSIENRARFPLMVIDRIRQKVGADFPLEYRMSGDEFMPGGYGLDEAVEFARMLEGRVDLIHVSATSFRDPNSGCRMFPSSFLPRGCNTHLAHAIKKAVATPVATVGAIDDPDYMEELLATGVADVIAVGRGLLADPFLPVKARDGHADDITPCTRCNHCISTDFVPYVPIVSDILQCAVNPVIGNELDEKYEQPRPAPKRVLVAGGGPGGMQAAITAARQGHEVILCEKSGALGGMLNMAVENVPFKEDLRRFRDVLVRRVGRSRVKVMLGTEVTPALAREMAPDILIAAVGAEPVVPSIPGMDRPDVMAISRLHHPEAQVGERVVIIGGGLVGCEEGLALAMRGKDVTILEMKEEVGVDAPVLHWKAMKLEFAKYADRLHVVVNTKCTAITNDGAHVMERDGEAAVYPADTYLISMGFRARTKVVDALRGCAHEVICVGDCDRPGKVLNAVHSGYNAGKYRCGGYDY